jgi:hypothetical protein
MQFDRSNRAVIMETGLDIHRYICGDWFAAARATANERYATIPTIWNSAHW